VAAGAAVFIACLLLHYLYYAHVLGPRLRSGEAAERRLAMKRWLLFAVVWQAGVLLLVAAYAFPMAMTHPAGAFWIAPPVGAVLGTAVPLQLALSRILRALL